MLSGLEVSTWASGSGDAFLESVLVETQNTTMEREKSRVNEA
jgi:hypothetical protein